MSVSSPPPQLLAAVTSLATSTPDLRTLLNLVVGNRTNKLYILSLSPSPLPHLFHHTTRPPPLSLHALSILGSLSPHICSELLPSLCSALLPPLFSPDPALSLASLRALKPLVSNHPAPLLAPLLLSPATPARLLNLLQPPHPATHSLIFHLITHLIHSPETALLFAPHSPLNRLLAFLPTTTHPRTLSPLLSALTSLSTHHRPSSNLLLQHPDLPTYVLPLLNSFSAILRLRSASLYASLPPPTPPPPLLALVCLLDNQVHNLSAATVLVPLVGRAHVANLVTEAGAVPSFANMLNMKDPSVPLRALAELCGATDRAREVAVDVGLVNTVVSMVENQDGGVEAVRVVKALSRSVKVVRKDLKGAKLVEMLTKAVRRGDLDMKRQASAALGNLCVEFAAERERIVNGDGVMCLIECMGSEDVEVRRNGIRGLRNSLFGIDGREKRRIAEKVGYGRLERLCVDSDALVRTTAMKTVRNLTSGGDEEEKELVVTRLVSGGILELVKKALENGGVEVGVQALYVACNVASGCERHKEAVMGAGLLDLVLKWTGHEDEGARVAALWVIINLLCGEKVGGGGQGKVVGRRDISMIPDTKRLERVRRMREMGYEGKLRSMVLQDGHVEVVGRARAALEMMGVEEGMLDYEPTALLHYEHSALVTRPSGPPVLLRVAESESSSGASP